MKGPRTMETNFSHLLHKALRCRDEFTPTYVWFMLYYPVNLMHYTGTILCSHRPASAP